MSHLPPEKENLTASETERKQRPDHRCWCGYNNLPINLPFEPYAAEEKLFLRKIEERDTDEDAFYERYQEDKTERRRI